MTNKRPLIDINNKNNLTTNLYPLFLGPELFVVDNVNITYPELVTLRKKLIKERWVEDEINLSKDAADIKNPDLKSATDVMRLTLQFQHLMDSVAAASISDILGLFCSNTELSLLLSEWTMNEDVHAATYSEIIKICFPDPNALLEDTRTNQNIIKRIKPLTDVFEATQTMGYRYKLGEFTDYEAMRQQIILFMAALTSLEAISFSASFASTFAIAKGSKAFDGISKNVQLIARDEVGTHVPADIELVKIMRRDPVWEQSYQAVKDKVQSLFDTVHEIERSWSESLFSEGRSIIGLNSNLLNKYVDYLCAPIYDTFDLDVKFARVEENPLPWMDSYMDLNRIQVAAQEGQITNYTVNNTVDDLDDDMDFDF